MLFCLNFHFSCLLRGKGFEPSTHFIERDNQFAYTVFSESLSLSFVHFCSFNNNLLKYCRHQRDSNPHRRSRRQAHWSLDHHHHGSFLQPIFVFKYLCRHLCLVHLFLSLSILIIIIFRRKFYCPFVVFRLSSKRLSQSVNQLASFIRLNLIVKSFLLLYFHALKQTEAFTFIRLDAEN